MWITKLSLKLLHHRTNKVLPNLISSQQVAHVKKGFIGESSRLIAHIIEIIGVLSKEEFLVTMDIEKVFDSLNHTFVIFVLKKFGFGNNFVSWIEILISQQESCAINGSNTAQYFHLERGPRQGDPSLAYVFILTLEVLSFLIRNNRNNKCLSIFDHLFHIQLMQMIQRFFLKTRSQWRNL